jgi:hypothetical protein
VNGPRDLLVGGESFAVPVYLVVGDGPDATRHKLGSVDLRVQAQAQDGVLMVALGQDTPMIG